MELNTDELEILIPLLSTHLVEVERVNPYDVNKPLPQANQLLKKLHDERVRPMGLARNLKGQG